MMLLICLISAFLVFVRFLSDTDLELRILAVFVSVLVLVGVSIVTIDGQSETRYSDSVVLADKWHEEPCSGLYDANGNYTGETCSDVWTFVGIVDDRREEFTVSEARFKDFSIGTKLRHNYSLGRLGLRHSDEWVQN